MSERKDYARKFDATVYDREYYEGNGNKSGYTSYEQAKGIIEDHFGIIERTLGLAPGVHLDVGCAYGFGCNYLAQKGWQSSGFDVSKYAIGRAKELFPDLTFWVGDAVKSRTYSKLEDKSIDLVTASELFEHIESDDVPLVLKQLQRVAKKGLFVVNAATAPAGEDWNPEQGDHDGDHGHLNHHNMSWWITQVAKFGELDWEEMFVFNKTAEAEQPDVHWHNRVIVVKFDDVPSADEKPSLSDKLDDVIESDIKESEGDDHVEDSSL